MDYDFKAITDNMANAALAGVAFPNAPQGHNGFIHAIDLMKPVDYISKEMKVVISAENVFSLRRSLAYALWIAQGCPDAAIECTPAHMAAAGVRIGQLYAYHLVFCAAGCMNPVVNITIRMSDALTAVAFDADAAMVSLLPAADAIHAEMSGPDSPIENLMPDSDLIMLCLIANDIHRDTQDFHNWYTEAGKAKKTNTSKILDIAGSKKTEFKKFMAEYGHDLWHLLSDTCMSDLADAIADSADPPVVFNAGFIYNGVDVNGQTVASVFPVGEAARDRHPAGVMGKGAVMVGIEKIRVMLQCIGSKVEISSIASLLINLDSLSFWVGNESRTKAQIKQVKTRMAAAICAGYGFFVADPANAVRRDAHPALAKFAETNASLTVSGSIMYKHLDSIEGDRKAMATTFSAALSGLAANITAVSAYAGRELKVVPYKEVPIVIPPTYAQAMMEKMAAEALEEKKEEKED